MASLERTGARRPSPRTRIARAMILVAILVTSFWITLQLLDYWREPSSHSELTPSAISDDRTAIFFHVGEAVRRDPKEVPSLVTSVGRRIPVAEGAPKGLVGSLTNVATDPAGLTTLDGWAVDQVAHRAQSQVVATLGDRIWISGFSDRPRPDITVHGPGYLLSGFRIAGRRAAKAQLGSLRMYVLLSDGTARELDYGPGIPHGPAER